MDKQRAIDRALEMFEDGAIWIRPDAEVSEVYLSGEMRGYWVQAWLWVGVDDLIA